jgi:hypothetical protein
VLEQIFERLEGSIRGRLFRMLQRSHRGILQQFSPEDQSNRIRESLCIAILDLLNDSLTDGVKQKATEAVFATLDFLNGMPAADLEQRGLGVLLATLAVEREFISREDEINVVRSALATCIDEEEHFQLPGFRRREDRPLNTWIYQNECMHFNIEPGDRVLDIGSGGWPFSHATHLADLHLGDTSHRMEKLERDERPFFVIDIHNMPFSDKAWDFVFCSHVLEHLERPGDACRELMRIGKRGYIETPTRLSDVMLNFTRLTNHHRYHALVLGNTLVLIEWADAERRDAGTDHFFQCLHSSYMNPFQKMFEDNWSTFYAMLHWQDRFDFLIIDKSGAVTDCSHD